MTDVRVDEQAGRRLKLVIAYQGQEFSGSQRQPGQRTIQQELEAAVSALISGPVRISMAGRTDAGVHALGQVASCVDVRPDLGTGELQRAINYHLPAEIAVMGVERVASDFDPRRAARWRAYRYRIWVGPRQPLLIGQSLQVDRPLNVMRILHGAARFEGEHELGSFAGLGKGVPGAGDLGARGTVRRIYRATAQGRSDRDYHGQIIEIDIVGDAFLPGQVRSMVGALLEVGYGTKQPDWIDELLSAADRRLGPKAAPPYGLMLVAVGYEDWDPVRITT